MDDAYRALLKQTDWLYTVLFRQGLLYWDYWSFVHLWCGFVLMAALMRTRVRRPVAWFLAVVVGYELFELVFLVLSIRVFQPEVLLDKLYDVIVGGVGGAVAWWGVPALRRASARPRGDLLVAASVGGMAAETIAFLWVGFYGYTYNVDVLNSPGLNWWAFTLWAGGLMVLLIANALLRRRVPNPATRIPLVLAGYAVGLLAAEYTGDVVLGIHEARSALYPPLLFGLIHGSGALRLFYGIAPLVALLGEDLMERLLEMDALAPAPVSALPAEASEVPI